MSRKRRLVKTIKNSLTQISRKSISAIKKKLVWLLRTLFVTKRRRSSANAGFVLPTVTMVSIVAVLLTTAIVFRSFDRAQNASNVRVNAAVLNAATPAIDRGRAKLSKLFQDTTLPRVTPTDDQLYNALAENNDKLDEYTFGDETPIKLIDPDDSNNTLDTAWRFPVDTDNNGKFDSYTLYGIYFKTPPVNSDNKYERARNSLEARTSPMASNNLDPDCGTKIPSLIGDTGWIKQNNELKKSFFVYTATVPITTPPTGADADNFEEYSGNKSFAAVEYQQDRIQNPNSYAVIYNDDVRIDTEANFNNRLNGAVFTNSNILNSSVNSGQITLHQVSSNNSCVFKGANAKISVGGNVRLSGTAAQIHLFQGIDTDISNTNLLNSVTNNDNITAYNNRAYEDRIQELVNEQMDKITGSDPTEVTNGINRRKEDLGLGAFTGDDEKLRREQLEFYFRKRTRRVPFAEVATIPNTVTQGTGNTLRPIDSWMYPTGNDGLTLNTNGASLEPKATEPDELNKLGGKEQELGDRVLVGNNLPEIWWDQDKGRFVGPGLDDTQEISGVKWNKPDDNDDTRTRRSAVKTFDDNIAFTERDGQWEVDAANSGLRIVTGAGIYSDANGSLNIDPTIPIWPDTKPVPGTGPDAPNDKVKPYWMYAYIDGSTNNFGKIEYRWEKPEEPTRPRLRMRATAVYGLADNPNPICVSSYYVPTNSTTAKNIADGGLSNNGIVYGLLAVGNESLLNDQADLTYPNGRSVDDGLLKRALNKAEANRTFAEQSAIDAQLCALQIINSASPESSVIDDGAIREIAFLDPREVQDNGSASTAHQYDKEIHDRKPVEIRATVLDLEKLPIPKSGLIYATRNDALPDDSAGIDKTSSSYNITDLNQLDPSRSPVDYKLDPTRRPNGIMLVNGGSPLWGETYDAEEKGFVLATNLPAYIKGDFNRHTQEEEFDEKLDGNWGNFYTRSKINKDFACRNGDPTKSCTASDTWRPASIIADAVTIVSQDFKEGFRDEGDYDWVANPATITPNLEALGFSKYNNFVTQADWPDNNTGRPKGKVDANNNFFSSYLNNFVTPIVLRAKPGGYLTEACVAPINEDKDSYCSKPENWRIQIGNSCNEVGPKNNSPQFLHDSIINDTSGITGNTVGNKWKTGFIFQETNQLIDEDKQTGNGNCFAGSNVVRRLAFLRNLDGSLVLPLQAYASAEGNGNVGRIQIFNFGAEQSIGGSDLQDLPDSPYMSMPWLNLQPQSSDPQDSDVLLPNGNIDFSKFVSQNANLPVLQLRQPFARPSDPNNNDPVTSGDDGNWLQPASNTTVNAVILTGDSPADPDNDENNGGLLNLVRYIENWDPPAGVRVNKISGSFGQVKKSVYATAPFTAVNSGTKYAIDLDDGERTGYIPPSRDWSYDVGLLTQKPDLLSEKMPTTPFTQLPDEYFREVGRSDPWVATLMCGKNGAAYAIPDPKQRPSSCQS